MKQIYHCFLNHIQTLILQLILFTKQLHNSLYVDLQTYIRKLCNRLLKSIRVNVIVPILHAQLNSLSSGLSPAGFRIIEHYTNSTERTHSRYLHIKISYKQYMADHPTSIFSRNGRLFSIFYSSDDSQVHEMRDAQTALHRHHLLIFCHLLHFHNEQRFCRNKKYISHILKFQITALN